MEVKSGTTIVAIKFKDGVILASDKRTSAGFIIFNKQAEKLHQITDTIIMGAAGLVGDINYVVKLLKANAKLKELSSKNRVYAKELANLLGLLFNQYKYFPFLTEVIIAGKDENDYYIYTIDEAGGISKFKDYTSTGSGMLYALGVLEAEYKENMDLSEAKELAKKAVKAAIERDMGSGDGIEIWVLTDKGLEKEVYTIEKMAKKNIN